MERRGWKHASPLAGRVAGESTQDAFLASEEEQRALLRRKGCACRA
jgi:hypothetical protein